VAQLRFAARTSAPPLRADSTMMSESSKRMSSNALAEPTVEGMRTA
jgi:hypothetical protein